MIIKSVHGGMTRSGKTISYPFNPTDVDHSLHLISYDTLDDNFDGFALFFYLVHEERKMGNQTEILKDFHKRMIFFQNLVSIATSMEDYRKKLGIQSDGDLLVFGKELVFKL